MTRLTILHTNDLHGRVQDLLRIATLVRRIREEVESGGGRCLYLDAGDAEDTSNLESSLTKGSAMEAILRGAGCDYLALGNAIPVRYGPEAIEDLATHFGKPLLCGNLFDGAGNLVRGLVPYTILAFGGLKVAIIGLTDPVEVYRAIFKLDARRPAEILPGLISQVRAQGAHFTILLSHLGSAVDQEVAESIPGIDIIIGGHDHKMLYPPLDVHGTIIAQAGEYGKFLGRLDIEIEEGTGKILHYSGELIPVEETTLIDPQAQQAVDRERERAHAIMRKRVGYLESSIELSADRECSAGNLLADALLERMKGSQVSLALAGHWRTGLEAGQVTQGEIFSANRSTANPAKVELSGKQILAFLREALKPENAARGLHSLRGGTVGMPHVAGMRVRYTLDQPPSLEVEIGDEPLREEKIYLVAATDFEFSRQINYLVIPDKQVEYEIPTIMPEVLQDYIRRNSPLKAPAANRVTSRTK